MWYMYHALFSDNKHYIGSAKTPHITKTALRSAPWRGTVQSIIVLEAYGSRAEIERKKTAKTKLVMAEYGIDNVRGGAFCDLVLRAHQADVLALEIAYENNYPTDSKKALYGTDGIPL